MTQHNFRLCAGELSQKFDSKVILTICLQSCSLIVGHYMARCPARTGERQVVADRLRILKTHLRILSKLVDYEITTEPTVDIMSITAVALPGVVGQRSSAVGFDLDPRRLSLVSPKLMKRFLSVLIKESISAVSNPNVLSVRLLNWAHRCNQICQEILNNLEPFMTASPFVIGDAPIPSMYFIMKLQVTRPPLITPK